MKINSEIHNRNRLFTVQSREKIKSFNCTKLEKNSVNLFLFFFFAASSSMYIVNMSSQKSQMYDLQCRDYAERKV